MLFELFPHQGKFRVSSCALALISFYPFLIKKNGRKKRILFGSVKYSNLVIQLSSPLPTPTIAKKEMRDWLALGDVFAVQLSEAPTLLVSGVHVTALRVALGPIHRTAKTSCRENTTNKIASIAFQKKANTQTR